MAKKLKGDITISVQSFDGKKKNVKDITSLSSFVKREVSAIYANTALTKIKKGMTKAQKEAAVKARKEWGLTNKKVSMQMHVKRVDDWGDKKTAPQKIAFENMLGTVPQKYLIIAKLFFLIVSTTPVDEEYKYTAYVNRKYEWSGKPGKLGSRELKSMRAVVRTHVPDEEVLRDLWCISVNTEEGNSSTFLSTKDFDVNWENENSPDYKKIAKKLREVYNNKDFSTFHIWNTYQSHDGFNKIQALEYGRYHYNDTKERHKGKPLEREHGLVGGYSIQAPSGFIRLAWQEVENANEWAGQETEKARAKDSKAEAVKFKATDIKSDINFNVYTNRSANTIYQAINELRLEGVKDDEMTRREIAEAIGKNRQKVYVGIRALNLAAKQKVIDTKEAEEQKRQSFEASKQIERKYKRQETNRKYYKNNKERILKNAKLKGIKGLQGDVSSDGQSIISGEFNLGIVSYQSGYDMKFFTLKGNLKLSKENLEELQNEGSIVEIETRDAKGDKDYAEVRIHQNVLQIYNNDDEEWESAAEHIARIYKVKYDTKKGEEKAIEILQRIIDTI